MGVGFVGGGKRCGVELCGGVVGVVCVKILCGFCVILCGDGRLVL